MPWYAAKFMMLMPPRLHPPFQFQANRPPSVQEWMSSPFQRYIKYPALIACGVIFMAPRWRQAPKPAAGEEDESASGPTVAAKLTPNRGAKKLRRGRNSKAVAAAARTSKGRQ